MMTALAIILLLIGGALLIGSFFLTEKLGPSEMQKMSELSDVEIKRILDKRLEDADQRINDKIEEAIDGSIDKVERALDRETNEKIMAIHEYSDTVIDEMSKTRDEIVFLYSMLNDRHSEMVETASKLKDMIETVADMKAEMEEPHEPLEPEEIKESPSRLEAAIPAAIDVQEERKEPPSGNHNRRILELSMEGKDAVAIAKELSLGVGEVQLVLGLNQRGINER